jgi:hypothetical protein
VPWNTGYELVPFADTYKSLHAEEFVLDDEFCLPILGLSFTVDIQVVVPKPDAHLPCGCI